MNLRAAVAAALLMAAASPAVAAPTIPAAVQSLAHRYYAFVWSADPVGSTDLGLHDGDGRLGDFSGAAFEAYGKRLRAFRDELASLAPGGETPHEQIDYLLLRADIEGDWWNRTVLRPWSRNPSMYESECTNGLFSLLKKRFAPDAVRARAAAARLRRCRAVLEQGRANLTEPVREFGVVASTDIAGGDSLFRQSLSGLAAALSPGERAKLFAARDDALTALQEYRRWLDARQSRWTSGGFAVGKEQYDWYLRRVLLLPYTSEQLLGMGRLELARDRALEAWERIGGRSEAPARRQPVFRSKAAFLAFYEQQTAKARAFVAARRLVTVPRGIGAFRVVELPKALAAINPGGFMNAPGIFDPERTGFYFVPDYDPKNTSFFAAQARRAVLPVLAHEGIPGHFLQFSIAARNPDFIRRVHGDGVFSEGWAFYGEEMLMRTGLYDGDPAAREAVIHLMRHRATRVGVDIGLATGTFTLPQAIAYFMRNAGIDRTTAYGEGTRFAMGPGQAIDYLTGKTQIETLLGLVRDREGDRFALGAFHDRLLSFGTIPLAAIRWEWLGDADWIERVREPIEPVPMTPDSVPR